jgi:hypothetical protein
MGNTWVVELWGCWEPDESYRWREVYRGESPWRAMCTMWRFRRWPCSRLTHRPSQRTGV